MEESEHWKEMFEKLLEISSKKITALEIEKEDAEVKLSKAMYKLHSHKIVTND